jgi:hypothetical protein
MHLMIMDDASDVGLEFRPVAGGAAAAATLAVMRAAVPITLMGMGIGPIGRP